MKTASVLQTTDLNQLRTFLGVYRQGSFTAAAAELGLSQPTVTAQIKALEKQLGRQLFERLPRGVEPTDYAHELASLVAEPLDSLGSLMAVGGLSGRRAPVHLGGPSELLCTRVIPALSSLIAEGVELHLSQGTTDELLSDIDSGQLDLLIATRRPRGKSLPSVPLGDEEYLLVASANWQEYIAQRQDQGETLAEILKDVPLVSYADDMPIVRRFWRLVLGRQQPPARPALTVPNLHAVTSAVANGAGYSVLPQSICEDHLSSGRILPLIKPEEAPLNTFFLVARPGAETNQDVTRVSDALVLSARDWAEPGTENK